MNNLKVNEPLITTSVSKNGQHSCSVQGDSYRINNIYGATEKEAQLKAGMASIKYNLAKVKISAFLCSRRCGQLFYSNLIAIDLFDNNQHMTEILRPSDLSTVLNAKKPVRVKTSVGLMTAVNKPIYFQSNDLTIIYIY